MERRALFRNSITLLVFITVVLCMAYIDFNRKAIPNRWVNETDVHLTRNGGALYYNDTLFSGHLYRKFPDGDFERITPYFKGKEEGIMKSWYPNHKPEQQRLFADGKKQGVHRGWWPNGNPKFEYYFVDDEHNGAAKEWFSNNTLYRFFNYKNGHEDGRQQMWWDNGTIRANYIVKDGQQYGLIGRKLCKNVDKNEKL